MNAVVEPIFSFTPEQKDKLSQWKGLLESKQAQEWARDESEAVESIHDILKKTGLKEGNDLTAEQLDDLFHQMRQLINNRAIASNLYSDNGLVNFNLRLRRLFFSNEPLAERVDQFIGLRGVAILTVSQFLCGLDSREYPEITWQTIEVLKLDSTQLDNAYKQALRENKILSPENYYSETVQYLQYAIVFREIKNLLHIERYNRVNNLLWLARQQVEEEVKPTITSVGLEADLRDRLAENPNLIEKGLSLVRKEYPTSGAGTVDLLCQDKRGDYVVIETKKGRESDKVVGQILRYIGGLKKEGKRTRGIIIVNEPDEKLDFAIEAVQDFIKLKYYKVKFEITDTYES